MRYISLFVMTMILFITITAFSSAANALHGEILEVCLEQQKVRVLIDGKLNILELAADAEIYRNGQLVELYSVRPIAKGRYQEGLFFLNHMGLVEVMIVDYSVEEKLTEQGRVLIYYDIFGNVKEVELLTSLQKEFTY